MNILKSLTAILAMSLTIPAAYASMDEQFNIVSTLFAEVDFYPTNTADLNGFLGVDGEEIQSFSLKQGESYSLVAICDDECSDLDLYVYDREGSVIGLDDDDTSVAIVDFTAAYSGRYDAEVTMYECSKPVCNYSVRAYVLSE